MLLLTAASFAYDFPAVWNRGVDVVHLPSQMHLPNATFRLGLDLQGGTHLVYDADMKQIPDKQRDDALEGVKNVIERRVNAFGVSEPLVQTTTTGGTYRLIIELAGIKDVSQAIAQIGETPVLEFKEPGKEVANRALTDAEKEKLKAAQKTDRTNAQAVLDRALKGEDFDALIKEKTIIPTEKGVDQITQATLKNITDNSLFGDLKKRIDQTGLRVGQVSRQLFENVQGINIFRLEEKGQTKEMQLSHILICFEGTTGCKNPIKEIEASAKIESLRQQATAVNFAQLAKENSTDSSAENGGDLGWGTPDKFIDIFAVKALATPVGGISTVVKTEYGYHLIYKRAERTVAAYTVKRIVMPLTKESDILPQASPWKNTELSGKQLSRATVQFDQKTGAPSVGIKFNSEGSALFGKLTESHVGQPIAIFLDGKVISAPVVQQAIYGGEAVITGNFSVDEAKLLAQNLNAGALPVPITLVSQQTVGPTLGATSLQQSIKAALIGFLLVAIFMLLAYRLPGLVAVIALLLFSFLNLFLYRFFDVTITLAGIAGLVLSIGIAVDANVLIFERMKEEFAAGRDFGSTVDEGFARAWPAIRDGHFTTLISAVVLYWFSSSFIRGFALTLAIGVVLSLFTAITVSRTYLNNTLAWKWTRNPVLLALKKK